MDNLRVVSLNVRSGINDKKKLEKFIHFMKETQWDIALLQETSKIKIKTKQKIEKELQVNIYQNEATPSKNAQGIAQLYKDELTKSVIGVKYHKENRISKIELKLRGKIYSIMNVYLNSNKKKRRSDLIDLNEMLQKDQNDKIIGGDFNSIIDKGERYARVEVKQVETKLIEIIDKFELTDVKSLKGDDTPTYIGQNNAAILDRFIVSNALDVADYKVDICPISDHQIIILDLFKQKEKGKRRKGLWKLNTELLKKLENKEKIKTFWAYWKEIKGNFDSYATWWDTGKKKIKKILIEIGIKEAKSRKDEETNLKEQMREEIRKRDFQSGKIYEIKNKLHKLLEYKIEGAKIRSRELQWPIHERGSRDFFAMEKKNIKQLSLYSILKENIEILDKNEIRKEVESFYKTLYTSEGIHSEEADRFIETMKEFKISDEIRKKINKFIGINEAKKVLDKMKNNKSPGSDGLPKEFYVEMWDTIGPDLVETLNNNIIGGTMTESQREGIIKLLYKKGDKRLLKNWRPVSLLNVDYKIMTAVAASRLIPVLQDNISIEQGCAIKGRYIYENLKLIKDLIEKHEGNTELWKGGKIKTIDQEKAFDRIEHQYIFKILERINLGRVMTLLIKIAYKNINTRVMLNSGLTDNITVTRSVRQGCPLSMALYIMASEPLLRNINEDRNLEGIAIDERKKLRVTAYADDTTIFIENNNDERIFQDIFNSYEKASGAKINKEKTKELKIGKYRKLRHVRTQEPIEILGILFHHNAHDNQKNNWNKTIEIIKNKLNKWKSRKLTILGRITTINSFGISQILYLNRIIEANQENIKRIQKILNNYIYDARPLNYANTNMLRDFEEGGFNLPDAQLKCEAQSLQWFIHYLGGSDGKNWARIFNEQNEEIIQYIKEGVQSGQSRLKKKVTTNQLEKIKKLRKIKETKRDKDWKDLTFRDIYQTLKKEKGKKFKIEENIRNLKWKDIWCNWKKREMNNKHKIMEHIVISDHFNTKKYYNKSKNCPGCDYAFVQSRDHTFMNCQGARSLSLYIKDRYKIDLDTQKIFFGQSPDKEYPIVVSYITTVMKMTERYIGKWGKARNEEKVEYFEKIYAKLRGSMLRS